MQLWMRGSTWPHVDPGAGNCLREGSAEARILLGAGEVVLRGAVERVIPCRGI